MLRALGETEWMLFYYVLWWPFEQVFATPWRAMVVAGILSGYYALVRLMLGRMIARFFDISSIAAIVLWIGYWPYELHMKTWERTVAAPIRLDLFLVGITLDGATVICLLSSLWSLFRKVKTTYYDGKKGGKR